MYQPQYHRSIVSGQGDKSAEATSYPSLQTKATKCLLVQVSSNTVVTSAGNPSTFVCKITGETACTVKWFHNGKICEGSKYKQLNSAEAHFCYLYIETTETSDGGDYKVEASNDYSKSEETFKVIVLDPVAPKRDDKYSVVMHIREFTSSLHRKQRASAMIHEFFEIERVPLELSQHNATLPCNFSKNRYCNVFPYDHSRIVLPLLDDIPGSDYINASFIPDTYTLYGYIATQGPLPHTFDDFWRMVWENGVSVIAMVTKASDQYSVLTNQYWPNAGSSIYGNCVVTLQETSSTAHFVTRKFDISNSEGKDSRQVFQFQFLSWPEYGVPETATELLTFRENVIKCHSECSGPLLVHCSAGVGRTGTFICLDSVLKRIHEEKTIDIFNLIRQLRFRRERTVETPEQYMFIHTAVSEAISHIDTT